MVKARPSNVALNAGEFGLEMLSRIDFGKYDLAGRRVENWLPRVTGGIERATGFRVIEETTGESHLRGFKSTRDLGYLAAFKAGTTKFYYDDAAVLTQAGVTVTNGDFPSGLSGWTDSSTGGGSVAGGVGGLTLTVPVASTGTARLDQNFTGATADAAHNISIEVTSGPVTVAFGSAQGASDYVSGVIDAGTHVFEVTPDTTDFWFRVSSTDKSPRVVASVASLAGTTLSVSNIYADTDLPNIRGSQLNDTMFLASREKELSSLARRGVSAFGFGREMLSGGPFEGVNRTSTTLTPSAVVGNATLTADDPFFEDGQIGRTLQIEHSGQSVLADITTDNTFTADIEISGSGVFRELAIVVTGLSGTGSTVTLQRSLNVTGNFSDVDGESYMVDQSKIFDDNLDGQEVFYRLGVKTGGYLSGTISVSMTTSDGSTVGEAEITAVASATSATARVTKPLGDTTATGVFSLSTFGGSKKHPIEAEFQEGRMFIASSDRVFGSQSDDFTNFLTGVDDADAIDRSPSSQIRWLLSMGDLGVGEVSAVTVANSGEFRQPYTPTNFRLRPDISRGASSVEPIAIDGVGIYVDRDGESLREVTFDEAVARAVGTSLTRLHPRITLGGIGRIYFQRAPENRIWVKKNSGELVGLTYSRSEDVVGWFRRKVDGIVQDIAIAEGNRRDRIYAEIEREIAGVNRRFLCVMDNEIFTEPSEANHLDFSYTPIKPEARAGRVTSSGKTGTITVTASESVFTSGDVGSVLFMSEGKGVIASFVSATEVTVTLDVPLRDSATVANGFWWVGAKSTAVTGLVGLESQSVSAFIDGVQHDGIAVDASGNATLPVSGAWVHVGHLMPDSVYESMKMVSGGQRGAATDGVTKRGHEVGVSVLRSGPSLYLGFRDESSAFQTFGNEVGNPFNAGQFFTGEHRQTVKDEHKTDKSVFIIAKGAAPATVLSFSADIKTNERS